MRLAVASLCAALLAARPATADSLAETARFLAGKGVAPDSSLADQAQSQTYTDYATQLASGWKEFEEPNLEHMRAWWTGRAPKRYSTVFYPFSGPDVGNALAFFPDADS